MLVTSGARRLVLGGNGRSMMLLRAFADPGQLNDYRKALELKAPTLGIPLAEVSAQTRPVLVRTVDLSDVSPAEDLIGAVRRFNEGLTQQLSPLAMAIAESKALRPETIEAIGNLLLDAENTPHPSGGEWSLRHIMADRVLGARDFTLIDILRADGIINNQNQTRWLRGGHLTDESKDRVEAMFMGRVLGSAERYTATSAAVMAKLERVVPYLLRVAGVNPGLTEIETIRRAVDLLNDASARRLSLADVVAQAPMFSPRPDKTTVELARILHTDGQKIISARFKAWAQYSAADPRQLGLFAETQPPSLAGARAILLAKKAALSLAA